MRARLYDIPGARDGDALSCQPHKNCIKQDASGRNGRRRLAVYIATEEQESKIKGNPVPRRCCGACGFSGAARESTKSRAKDCTGRKPARQG